MKSATFSRILEILEISVFLYFWTPGNIGNLIFLYFGTPGNIGNLSLQHSPESWKYYPIPEPNPKPKPISLLGPGTGNSGYCGRTRTGYCGRTRTRAAGASQNPNPLRGLRPPRPPVGFFRDGRGPGDANDDDDDAPTTLPSGQTPGPSRPGTKYPVRGQSLTSTPGHMQKPRLCAGSHV